MLSTKRLQEFFDLRDKYDQEKGEIKYKTFEAKPGQFAVDISNLDLTMKGNKVFTDLQMKVRQGERVAIIGPSGSGKHSLFKLILGLYKPDNFEQEEEQEEKKKKKVSVRRGAVLDEAVFKGKK